MKSNKNVLWSKVLVKTFSDLGVSKAVVSPGSRNSPLLTALAEETGIKKYSHVDERSAGFFALGLAKATGEAVILCCTSGTAAGEYYPAIMEAYRSRIPLIVLTADRPKYLVDACANQTINQQNLYSENVRLFYDAGIPEITEDSLMELKSTALVAYRTATDLNKGPVHLNMPFEKPLEAQFKNCEIDDELLNKILEKPFVNITKPIQPEPSVVLDSIKSWNKGVIFAGPDNYDEKLIQKIIELSEYTGYPVVADINSNLRFTKGNKNILVHFDTYFHNKRFVELVKAKVIVQFGNSMTSNKLEEYIKADEPFYYVVNQFGDTNDPYRISQTIKYNPIEFCDYIITNMEKRENTNWVNGFLGFENEIEKVKRLFDNNINKIDIFECSLIENLIEKIPEGSNVFVSNSMVVRDFDLYSGKSEKKIKFYHNRGVSGIDGTIATALGVSEATKETTVLVTGDLSFIYDVSSYLLAKKYNIPLIVILINNNGGSIFNYLPIAEDNPHLEEYFTVPYNIDFAKLVAGYGGKYMDFKETKGIEKKLLETESASVITIEVKIDAKKSFEYRKTLKHRIHEVLEVLL